MKMNMRRLLMVSMLGAGLLPLLATTAFIKSETRSEITRQSFSSLEGMLAGRAAHLKALFEKVTDHAVVLADDGTVMNATALLTQQWDGFANPDQYSDAEFAEMQTELQKYYTEQFAAEYETRNGEATQLSIPEDPQTVIAQYQFIANNPNPLGEKHLMGKPNISGYFANSHAFIHGKLADFLDRFGYYDIFIVEPENGRVVYSVYKELDYATKLFNGPYRDTGLAEAARRALTLQQGEVAWTDFGTYYPSYDAPAMFVGSPIYNPAKKLIGALVFQMPVEPINAILAAPTGLGEGGRILAVGPDNLMRSQDRLVEDNTIIASKLKSDGVDLAIDGNEGSFIEEVDGESALLAYMPASVPQLDWALLAKMPYAEAFAVMDRLLYETVAAMVLAALFVGFWAFMIGRVIYQRLGGDPVEILSFAQALSAGDLRSRPQDQDRIGAYSELVAMREKMSDIISDAKSITVDVNQGMGSLREGNRGLSSRTEQQAANLEQTAASTEEITSAVRQNAENAKAANELAMSTRERASAGGKIAERAVGAMHEISKSSEQIAAIIGVIDEIAFQTNLLALNAAVEAARAGEQGRGFAVVASEVRQLAGRSASAAREIKDLIESSVAKVKDGTDLVETSGKELTDIVDLVAELTSVMGQITQASEEQALGIDQINDALIHMDSSTQQNAALVEQAAVTAESMNGKAGELKETVDFFKVDQRHNVIRAKANARSFAGSSGSKVVGAGSVPLAVSGGVESSEAKPVAAVPAKLPAPATAKPRGGDDDLGDAAEDAVWEQF
ncbi:MAG: methyl-accepting chemotaxis protein [Pseudomonadota bacterium]